MPWCDDCQKYHAPSAMSVDERCPTCGRVLEAPAKKPRVTAKTLNLKQLAAGEQDQAENEDDQGAPWHFKLLMVLMVLYLVWRIVDLFR